MSAKILIVDDEAKMRRVLQLFLEEHNYAVAQAENGEVALEKIGSFHPDLVICDIRMPRLNGIELLRHAKKILKR
jgi:CheY-like chemotaxis protein